MIDRAPQVMHLAVDLHIDLVEVPTPMGNALHPTDTLSPNGSCEHRAEPVPPEPDCLMEKVDAAFEQQILDIAQRQWEADDIITTSRITSGDELKQRNGFGGFTGDFRFMGARYQRCERSATLV